MIPMIKCIYIFKLAYGYSINLTWPNELYIKLKKENEFCS